MPTRMKVSMHPVAPTRLCRSMLLRQRHFRACIGSVSDLVVADVVTWLVECGNANVDRSDFDFWSLNDNNENNGLIRLRTSDLDEVSQPGLTDW